MRIQFVLGTAVLLNLAPALAQEKPAATPGAAPATTFAIVYGPAKSEAELHRLLDGVGLNGVYARYQRDTTDAGGRTSTAHYSIVTACDDPQRAAALREEWDFSAPGASVLEVPRTQSARCVQVPGLASWGISEKMQDQLIGATEIASAPVLTRTPSFRWKVYQKPATPQPAAGTSQTANDASPAPVAPTLTYITVYKGDRLVYIIEEYSDPCIENGTSSVAIDTFGDQNVVRLRTYAISGEDFEPKTCKAHDVFLVVDEFLKIQEVERYEGPGRHPLATETLTLPAGLHAPELKYNAKKGEITVRFFGVPEGTPSTTTFKQKGPARTWEAKHAIYVPELDHD